jgi:hypothetical protein
MALRSYSICGIFALHSLLVSRFSGCIIVVRSLHARLVAYCSFIISYFGISYTYSLVFSGSLLSRCIIRIPSHYAPS